MQLACGPRRSHVAAVRQRDGAPQPRRGQRCDPQVLARPCGDHPGHDRDPQARPYEAEHGVHLAALHRELGFEALRATGGHRQLPQVVAVPEHHHRFVLEVGDPYGAPPPRGRPGRGREDHEVLLEQLHRGQHGGSGGQRQHQQGEVERTPGQLPYQVVRAALLDQQLDTRVQVVEDAQHVGQQSGAHARSGTEPHPPPAQLHQLLHLVPGGVRVRQDPAGQRQQCLTRVGEGDVAPGPAEQLGAQLALQGLDLLGERGLRHVHDLGGPGEVPGLGDRDEIGELLEVHEARIATLHR